LVGNRTALCNQIRALLVENGIYAAQGVHVVATLAADIAAGKHNDVLSHVCRTTITDLRAELVDLEERIDVIDQRITTTSAHTEACRRLQTIPGIGPLTSTAIVAAVANPAVFKNGRHFAAWLGLVPRHEGTGGKNRLLGISKRGDGYIRKLLIQGAHSVLNQVQRKTDRLSSWSKQVLERRGRNKAAVALANKNARIIWRLLASADTYDPSRLSAAGASP
jgi:transposase